MQLFKYVSAERFDILKNELIRFSPATALNDPWEMKPHVEQFMPEEKYRELLTKENPIAQRNHDIRMYWKIQRKSGANLSLKDAKRKFEEWEKKNPFVLPLVQVNAEKYALQKAKDRDPQFKKLYLKQFEELGVLSLTEEPNNLLMWAHYANSHKGFVIELDFQHGFFSDLRRRPPVETIGRIVYAEKLPHLQAAEDIFKDGGLEAMLFTKDQRWSYEKEWRLVADCRDATHKKTLSNGEVIWLYSLPADCIKRVVIGCSMSDANKRKITDYLKIEMRYRYVRVQEAVRVEREYNLDFKDAS